MAENPAQYPPDRENKSVKALGIDFVSYSEQMDTSTPAGKMVFTVLGAVTELERSLIVERVRASLRNARAKDITRLIPPSGWTGTITGKTKSMLGQRTRYTVELDPEFRTEVEETEVDAFAEEMEPHETNEEACSGFVLSAGCNAAPEAERIRVNC